MRCLGSAFSTFAVFFGVYGSSVRGIRVKNIWDNWIFNNQDFIEQETDVEV